MWLFVQRLSSKRRVALAWLPLCFHPCEWLPFSFVFPYSRTDQSGSREWDQVCRTGAHRAEVRHLVSRATHCFNVAGSSPPLSFVWLTRLGKQTFSWLIMQRLLSGSGCSSQPLVLQLWPWWWVLGRASGIHTQLHCFWVELSLLLSVC